VRRAAVALSLAVLFFGRQIAAWSVAENRYLYHWQRADSIYLIGAVVAAALLALVLDWAVRRLGGARARQGLRLAFALAMGQVLVGLVLAPDAEKPFEGAALAAFVVAGLTLYRFRRAEDRVVKVAVTAAPRRAARADTLSPDPLLEILARVRRAGARAGPAGGRRRASHLHPAVRRVVARALRAWRRVPARAREPAAPGGAVHRVS
jgi:hypothetical protein